MPENSSKIELRSEEVKEILGHVPHWLVRWGIILLFVCISLILIGTWIFKYPDIVKAEVIITTENPPSHGIARADGRIMNLFVNDNEAVTIGQVLAIIENPSRFTDVMLLKTCLDSFRQVSFTDSILIPFNFPQNLVLGDMQSYYAYFLKQYDDLQNFLKLGYHDQKIKSIQDEIISYRNYSGRLRNQYNILAQEEKITAKQYRRDSTLFRQGVIPEADMEKTRTILLQKSYNLEQSLITLSSNSIQISKLEQQILDLALQKNQEESKLKILLNEAFENLSAQISLWEQRYVIKAPVNGIVSFTRIWSENQNVRTGELVMSVIPHEQGSIIGKINLPVRGSGKVKTGQRVNIKLDSYPHMEFGLVRGTIRSISLVTSDNLYSVLLELGDGLKTNYGITLLFNQEMLGSAEIITDDRRLLERIVYPVKAVITKQRGL